MSDETNPPEPTKAELQEQARDLGVEGRSSMTKEELAEAVEEAQEALGEESQTLDEYREQIGDEGVADPVSLQEGLAMGRPDDEEG